MSLSKFSLLRSSIISLLFLVCFQGIYAQGSILFNTDEPLKISIKTDLKKLIRSKPDDTDLDSQMSIDGTNYPVRLKVRGNYNKDICSFPPVILNFNKTNFSNPDYSHLKNMKLVSACEEQNTYEQYILREYMAYRIFNMLTEKSLKVRLLIIDFEDSKGKLSTVTRYGLLVEDQFMMARRLGGMMTKEEGLKDQDINNKQMVLFSIFQFMIGNTDWQLSKLNNLYLMRLSKGKPYVIPFNFTNTGMVNASYASPSPVLGIESVRNRLYQGECYTEQEFKTEINVFLERKADLMSLYKTFEYFDDTSRNEALDYINSFYNIIENGAEWKKYFLVDCQN